MRRRAFLAVAAGVAAGSAGCLGSVGFGTDCPRSFTLSLDPTDDAETAAARATPVAALHPVAGRVFERAREAGPARFTAAGEPPFRDPYVRAGGGFYRVRAEVVDSRGVEGYEFAFTVRSGTPTDAGADATAAIGDLPAADRLALRAALGFHGDRWFGGDRDHEVGGDGVLAYPDPEARAESVLVPEPQYDYVVVDGSHLELDPTGERTVTVETTEVRVERAAGSAAELAALVYERRGVDLSDADLSPAARDVLSAATGGEYTECLDYEERTTYAAGLREVRDALALAGDDHRLADYARYEGQWYAVQAYEAVV